MSLSNIWADNLCRSVQLSDEDVKLADLDAFGFDYIATISKQLAMVDLDAICHNIYCTDIIILKGIENR